MRDLMTTSLHYQVLYLDASKEEIQQYMLSKKEEFEQQFPGMVGKGAGK